MKLMPPRTAPVGGEHGALWVQPKLHVRAVEPLPGASRALVLFIQRRYADKRKLKGSEV